MTQRTMNPSQQRTPGRRACGAVVSARAALLLIAACAAGCQGLGGDKTPSLVKKLDVPDGVPWKAEKPPEPGIPARIVVTWTDAVLQRSGQSAERGFGGRLYFYATDEAKPIPVSGQLVVYAFDETGRKSTDNRPTRRYVFPPHQFALHQSESEIGVSYSVWLPWDEMGSKGADVSLIARFEPLEGGKLIVSEQARNRLPGPLDGALGVGETKIASTKLTPDVRQASHAADIEPSTGAGSADEAKPKRRMETTSIKLPSRAGQ